MFESNLHFVIRNDQPYDRKKNEERYGDHFTCFFKYDSTIEDNTPYAIKRYYQLQFHATFLENAP